MIEAGFKDVEVVPYALLLANLADARKSIIDLAFSAAMDTGVLSQEQVDELHEDMIELASKGAFLCTVTVFLAVGYR